jgi:wyosine [tRNA(Phe)-imidazoG37] synthetase (radical SAM superfamily)
MLNKKTVFNALLKVEDNILKLDSAFEKTIRVLDCPNGSFNLENVVEQLINLHGKVIIQTMFLKGSFKGTEIDNTTKEEVAAWIDLLKKIKPAQVMIYTIARDTPLDSLEKIPVQQLNLIAERVRSVGFDVQVSG